MTNSTMTPVGAPAADVAAFRSVLASPEELLVLVLVDSVSDRGLATMLTACGQLRQSGIRWRPVIYGTSMAALEEAGLPGGEASVLEKWVRPVLPSLLVTADVLLFLGREEARTALAGPSERLEGVPLIASPECYEAIRYSGRDPVPWDGEDIGGLVQLLRKVSEAPLKDVRNNRATTRPPAKVAADAGVAPLARVVEAFPRHAAGDERAGLDAAFVLYNDWGLGDELLLSAVARELVRAHPGAAVWVRSRYGFPFKDSVRKGIPPRGARSVEVIYQNPTLYSPQAHSPFPGHLVQQMLDKFSLDTGLRTRAEDLRPELDLRLRPKPSGGRPSVILHTRPNSRLSSKDWGLQRWQRLSSLLRDAGIHVRQVGGTSEPLLESVEDLRGTPPGELPAIFLESSAVICVVGFLMHLAEAVGLPAIVLYGGREHPAIDGYPDQVHLCSEPLPCRGRWGCHLGPDLECPHGMKCMEQLTPELVLREVLATLRKTGGGCRT